MRPLRSSRGHACPVIWAGLGFPQGRGRNPPRSRRVLPAAFSLHVRASRLTSPNRTRAPGLHGHGAKRSSRARGGSAHGAWPLGCPGTPSRRASSCSSRLLHRRGCLRIESCALLSVEASVAPVWLHPESGDDARRAGCCSREQAISFTASDAGREGARRTGLLLGRDDTRPLVQTRGSGGRERGHERMVDEVRRGEFDPATFRRAATSSRMVR
ncbi:hypothetical protein WA016_04823 [Myxococcus stipitatus]